MTPSRGMPARRTTRTVRDTVPRIPTRRAGPIGGQPSGPPADNDTGLPKTPTAVTAPDAHSDTDTMAWNEEWDDSSKPKTTPEDSGNKIVHENADGKAEPMPGIDDSTKATQKSAEIAPLGQAAPVPLDEHDEQQSDTFGDIVGALEAAKSTPSTQRMDDPPSPADVPEDMRYDPEGEGIPGLMPPIAAPVPGDENDKPGGGGKP